MDEPIGGSVKYIAKMSNGWDVEIDKQLYNRIRAGLAKYPSGGSTLFSPHVLLDGSIVVGKYLVGIEVIDDADNTREFVDDISGEVLTAAPGTDYGAVMPLDEFIKAFEESGVTHKVFADKTGLTVAYLKRILDGGSPVTAKITQKVNEFMVEENG